MIGTIKDMDTAYVKFHKDNKLQPRGVSNKPKPDEPKVKQVGRRS